MYLLPASIKGSNKWCFGQASPVLEGTELKAAAALDQHLHVLITHLTRTTGDLHAVCEYTASTLQCRLHSWSSRHWNQLCSLMCTTHPFALKAGLKTQVCNSSSKHTVGTRMHHSNANAMLSWSASVELVKLGSAGGLTGRSTRAASPGCGPCTAPAPRAPAPMHRCSCGACGRKSAHPLSF